MIIAAFIPFFLAVQLPIEDGAWPYGPEYIFTVHMNVTGIPQCPRHVRACGTPAGYRITSRLYCIPRRNDTLSCNLRYIDGFDFGMIGEEDDVVNRRKNITDAPIELLFNEEGIVNIITSQLTRIYDLNILKMVAEQLHPGSNFNNIEDNTFEGVSESTIGRCNVTFDVHHRSENVERRFHHGFRLKLLPWKLHMTSIETLVIDKITNLNDCSCYADGYFRKYGDTVVFERLQADLEIMISQMEISETSFSSSTTRKGISVSNRKTYDIIEITKIILEDIRPAERDPPTIINPGESKILANYDIRNIY
ncbi:uncharacterized protein LOC105833879 [Monomorium pharaonis]|uniref:uncharacterized protein LOC105833879 n=1 Tax=Monomorium pharaonis TaxID=307658 RepID=UPI00063F6ECE|nr:uncharacterized protein LOC105833879 [Monomorium pharaonis]